MPDAAAESVRGRSALVTGADVAIHYHGPAAGAQVLATDILAMGRRAELFDADFTDAAAARHTVRRAIEVLGRLDILVGPVATLVRTPFLETTDDD